MSAADGLSKEEKSLLLFLETRAVDYGGRVNAAHMNADDFMIAKRWTSDGFLEFGRIRASDHNRDGAHYVRLSRAAQGIAAELREARAERGWANRRYQTVAEKAAEGRGSEGE